MSRKKKRKPCIHYLNTLYLYLCYHPIVKPPSLQMPGCVSNPAGFEAASNPKMKSELLNRSKLNRFETSKSKPKQRLRSRRFVYFEFPNIVDKLSETGVIIHHVVKISPCFYKRSNPQLFLGGML